MSVRAADGSTKVVGEELPWVSVLAAGSLGTLLLVGSLDAALESEDSLGRSPTDSTQLSGGVSVPASPAVPPTRSEPTAPEVTADDPPTTRTAAVSSPSLCAPSFEVTFEVGRARTSIDRTEVERIAEWLKEHPHPVLVDGHSDAMGRDDRNLRLSYRRAQYVRRELVRSGLSDEKVTVRAFGEFQPRIGIDAHSAAQRRVVVRVVGVPPCEEEDLEEVERTL